MEIRFAKVTFYYIFLIVVTFTEGSGCPSSSPGDTFGLNCEFLCHCKDVNQQCNETTGECTSCADTWMGPGCQYRNMAFKKPTRHIDNVAKLWASRAVDSSSRSCSETAESNSATASNRGQDPFWKVWLKKDEIITGLIFKTTQEKLEQIRGFQIFVDHVENLDSIISLDKSLICYTHTDLSPLEATMDVACDQPLLGNLVRFQLPNRVAQIVLCDVRIYGGREFAFGRTTEQSTNWDVTYLSQEAVDGSDANPGSCSLTRTEQNPWWKIDFGHTINIQALQINKLAGCIK